MLKNGEVIALEVTPLILEYIGDYPGGLKQLQKDAQSGQNENGYSKKISAVNQLLYAIVASNYDHAQLTYRQAVRLVKLEDVNKIIEFIGNNTPKAEEPFKQNINHRM